MPGIELMRSRLLAWTSDTLVLASRSDGRVLAQWRARYDPDPDDEIPFHGEAAVAWTTLPNPERVAIELGTFSPGSDEPDSSEIALVDPATGAITRRGVVFRESHAVCGWTPDGARLFVSGMGQPRPSSAPPASSGEVMAEMLAAIMGPSPMRREHGPGLACVDIAKGRIDAALPFDELPHCDRLVFRPDGKSALSRSLSQYRAHFARLDFDGPRARVAFAAPIETWRVHPLPGFREAIVIEAGYLGPRVLSQWDLQTGERTRVLYEIPEERLQNIALNDRYPSLREAWPVDDHVVAVRGDGVIVLAPEGRELALRAESAETVAVAGSTVYAARGSTVEAVRVGTDEITVAAKAGAPIVALATDAAAGELIALTKRGALRAFRIPRA